MLEKLRRKSRIGSKKQRHLSFDVTSIEMGHGHRGRSHGGFAVHLGIMPTRYFRIVAAKPDAAHRKSSMAPTLGNPGFLQQRQRSAAGADENKLGLDIPVRTGCFIPRADY